MKLKQLIAIILCISMLAVALAGCNSSDTDNDPVEDISVDVDTGTENDVEEYEHVHSAECGHPMNIDFDAALAAFEPDTVMLRSDDLIITWAELYVFLFRTVSNILHAYGMEIDWGDSASDGNTVSDLLLEYATEEAISFLIYMYGIDALDFELSDEELQEFNEDIEEIMAMYGGKEALEEDLREHGGFYNFEVFENLYKLEFTIGFIVEELYGDDASKYPDESVEEFAIEHEFMMAMHILRLKTEDEDDNTPVDEIEDILSQLTARVGSNDFIDFFKELMEEHSEDHGGLISFPDGYLFQPNDMVPEFSDACAELEEGEISGIVETMYGYHIILRLPIDFEAVPISVANEGIPRTLRQIATLEDFDNLRNEWRDALNIVFSPEYNSINLGDIFVASYN